MKRSMLILVAAASLLHAQEPGTMLLDDATSSTYVVTNAYQNAESEVRSNIQEEIGRFAETGMVDRANSANTAGNAAYAETAGTADTATHAQTSDTAISAETAQNANSAIYAESSDVANESLRAHVARDAEYIYKDDPESFRIGYDEIKETEQLAESIRDSFYTNVCAIVTNRTVTYVGEWIYSGGTYDPSLQYSVSIVDVGNGYYQYILQTNGIDYAYSIGSDIDHPFYFTNKFPKIIGFSYLLPDGDDMDVIATASTVGEVNTLGIVATNDLIAATNRMVEKVEDRQGNYTAVTLGSRLSTQSAGRNSASIGLNNTATGDASFAQGSGSRANGEYSVSLGSKAVSIYKHTFTWNQSSTNYNAKEEGTFNINPLNGVLGFYIGTNSLYEVFRNFLTSQNVVPISDGTSETNAPSLRREIYDIASEAAQEVMPDTHDFATRTDLETVANEAQVIYRLFSGSNVVDEITNYNSVVRLPSRRLYQLDTNGYHMVWNEMDQHTNTLAQAKKYAEELGTNYAPRAWSRTTAMYGAEAPSNTTWISTPTTVIAAGYEYQKYATSGGAIWVLTSRGATYDFSPNTNNTAFLNIAAQDGTPIFRIEKTDSYLLGVNPTAIWIVDNVMFVDVNLVAASHPFVRIKETLSDPEWAKEEDDIPAELATVSWTPTATGYRCQVTNNTGGSSLFAYFEYLQEGSVKIVNGGVLDISGGLIVNGTTYTRIGTATISGHTVLTLEP